MPQMIALPDWLPWWVPLVLLVPTALWALSFLFMPFSVFGVKSRLEVIEARLDEIQNEIRHVALRLPAGGLPGPDYDEVYPPRMQEPRTDRIMSRLDEVYINGSTEHRLPGNLNISFAYVEGESLLMGINDIAVSSGSACTSATLEPSYVLKALGTGDDLAHSSIRFGIGRFNTEAEVDYVADRVVETVERLRELSPLYEMAKEGVDLKSVKWAGEAH